MSANPWMKRHKRDLSFRYIFPRVAAVGIVFRRSLLRIGWFFTHSIGEFLEDAYRGLRGWRTILSHAWRGTVVAASQFVKGLAGGIESVLRGIGRLPVWTVAAFAGVMGILLTLLLFLLPAIQTRSTPAAIGSDFTSPPLAAASVSEKPLVSKTVTNEKNWADDEQFDPFAPLPVVQSDNVLPKSRPEPEPFAPVFDQPQLFASWLRLSMPLGWEAGRQIDVVSLPQSLPQRDGWMAFAASGLPDGWKPRRADRTARALEFSPYVSRIGERLTQLTPRWIAPKASFDPASFVASRRQPSVVVEKTAPQTAAVGQPFAYALIVTNVGDERLESVQVRERVSAIERVSNVEPSANVVGDALVWDLTDLQPGERRRLRIEFQADEPITLAQHTTVEVTSGVGALSEVRHPRPEPQLAEREPRPVQVEPNPAPDPASEQPREILPDFGPPPTEPAIPEKEPATDDPRPALMPRDFDSANGPPPQQEEPPPQQEPPLPAEAPAAAPQPQALAIEMSTPSAVLPGSDIRTFFVLRNRGETDLTNVVLAVELSDELQHQHGRSLELCIGRLAAGETYRTRLTTRAAHDGNARISSRVRSPNSREQTAQRNVQISRNLADSPTGGCAPAPCHCGAAF